ncbi:lytic transglycosylase domain-containing protein [Falsirhodobacter sp. alg1]|uniref:lytic transglycosylase domain-containing protein n=1 Tax=Falsirhodobacter sp. alg1 TaxID=1472418 RepID=UPI000787493B|nr:lytic transglycosylase domain-containing protein [Falsirhodobacter sp. alg1]
MKPIALALCLALTAPLPLWAQDADSGLAAALKLAATRDWSGAIAVADGQIAKDIIEWQRLRAGDGTLQEYEMFLARRADWPGLPLMHEKGEATLATTTDAQRITDYFRTYAPQTAEGAITLSRAWLAQGRNDLAEQVAVQAWATLSFTEEQQDEILRMYPSALAAGNIARTDRLLWAGELDEAAQMIPHLPFEWQALTRARIALRSGATGVDDLINAVPDLFATDPGLVYERFAWRIRAGRDADAAELLEQQDADPNGLGQPERWARYRIYLVRELKDSDPDLAYKLAKEHQLTEGGSFADLEFLAGHIALRRLNNPALALEHFSHLEEGVSTEISLSRAYYWKGRAYEAMGDTAAATQEFERAAAQSSAYYGLLAAEHLGRLTDPAWLAPPPASNWQRAGFANSSVLNAAQQLLAAGDFQLGRRFILHLAETQSGDDLESLADMALEMDEPNIALSIAKQAAYRGVMLHGAYYPTPSMVPEGLAVTRAFALAISRRESEFDPKVISPAGARGLMQLLPGTASLMADKLGTQYSVARLTEEPGYNVRLGASYLQRLVEEFGPSVALVASGYNAGPGRSRAWIESLGDPRDPNVDIVDWVEDIPYGETRTYVMRVVESLVIYRAKLAGVPIPVRVTDELRG